MFIRYNLFGILWALLILVLCLMPGDSMPYTNIWDEIAFDKLAHLIVFAVLVVLLIIGFTKQYSFYQFRKRAIQFALLFSISYGIIVELLQSFSVGRTIEFWDIAANIIGCFLGYLIFLILYKF